MSRNPFPLDRNSRHRPSPDRLDHPGPKQRLVLEALAVAAPSEKPWLTGKAISKITRLPEGSVYGCTSGMMNMRDRKWIEYEDVPSAPKGPYRNSRRYWKITPAGMAALLKDVRLDRQLCPCHD